MPSSRTYDADTTNSRSTSRSPGVWQWHSTSWPWRSDALDEGAASACHPATRCNRAAATKQLSLASLGSMPELPMVPSVTSIAGDHNPHAHTNGSPGKNSHGGPTWMRQHRENDHRGPDSVRQPAGRRLTESGPPRSAACCPANFGETGHRPSLHYVERSTTPVSFPRPSPGSSPCCSNTRSSTLPGMPAWKRTIPP